MCCYREAVRYVVRYGWYNRYDTCIRKGSMPSGFAQMFLDILLTDNGIMCLGIVSCDTACAQCAIELSLDGFRGAYRAGKREYGGQGSLAQTVGA